MTTKSEKLATKLAELQAELDAARKAEEAEAEEEMLRLIRRAGMRDEVIRLAKNRIAQKGRGKRDQKTRADGATS